jgi:hypothetical protein
LNDHELAFYFRPHLFNSILSFSFYFPPLPFSASAETYQTLCPNEVYLDKVQAHVALYVLPEVMARVCAQDKAEGNGSMAAEVTSSEGEVLIVFLKLQYYSYKTGFCTRSQAVK